MVLVGTGDVYIQARSALEVDCEDESLVRGSNGRIDGAIKLRDMNIVPTRRESSM